MKRQSATLPQVAANCLASTLAICVFGWMLLTPQLSAAQPVVAGLDEGGGLEPAPGLLRNAVSTLAAQGDSLWAGPYLNLTTDDGESWEQVSHPDIQRQGPNRTFSLALRGDSIAAGLGTSAGEEQAAAGFLVSTDGGESFSYRIPQLDAGTEESIQYGISQLDVLPVTAPEQSPPFDLSFGDAPGELWVAGWASGIRKSTDFGETWDRVVLPPDDLSEITPEEEYDFTVEPERGDSGHRNYLGFSVLHDAEGIVWAGTVAGVNRSTPGDIFPEFDGDRRWERLNVDDGLTGNWVTSIEEHHHSQGHTVWMATWAADAGEDFGVSFTRDGGASFQQTLIGERVNDFAFDGDTVYAAANNGLFVLSSEGNVIQQIDYFDTPEQPGYEAPSDLDVFAVATTREALWAGTVDGLFRSFDGGETWRVFRAEVPVDPDEPTEDIPAVETYAYPNPFSPSESASGKVRFVVEVNEPRSVAVNVYDYAMNHVRELRGECRPNQNCEVSWDATDRSGRLVANGTYFYTVETGDGTVRGKLVILE